MQIQMYKAEEMAGVLNHLAEMRLKYFKEFPYLYDGKLEDEEKGVRRLSKDKDSILILVSEGDDVVAVSSAAPLKGHYMDVPENTFTSMGLNASEGYYFGEIIVKEEFRKRGVATEVFKLQEDYAARLGYKFICFMVVERDKSHPLKPLNYEENDKKWEHMGYIKTDISISFTWPTIQANGKTEDRKNRLNFWIKRIGA